MNKYLIVEFKTTRRGTFLKHAYYINNGREQGIKNLNKVANIVNKYNGDIYEKIDDNVYKISNRKVINEFQKYKVERRNKYIGIALAGSVALGSALMVADAASNFVKDTEESKSAIASLVEKVNIEMPEIKTPKYTISNTEYSNESYNNVISFSFTDRTNTNTYNHTRENYSNAAYENSIKYGVDYELIMAMICQENPYNKVNNSDVGANGVMQIENVWYDQNVRATCYNDERGYLEYETVKVDKDSLIKPEYSIKIGCMILNNYFENIYKNYVILNDTLTESEALEASIRAYNKGITAISNLINEYGSDYDKHLSETQGGDNEYLEHVVSYLKDGYKVQFRTFDGHTCSSYIDNTTVDTFKR